MLANAPYEPPVMFDDDGEGSSDGDINSESDDETSLRATRLAFTAHRLIIPPRPRPKQRPERSDCADSWGLLLFQQVRTLSPMNIVRRTVQRLLSPIGSRTQWLVE